MKRTLQERLDSDGVICAEGYLFALERRGYVQAGAFVPEVVLEAPEAVEMLHREFVRAGSDIVEAFTYYGHREKLRVIGKEDVLEPLNRKALEIAKKVAREAEGETPLLAGNICNTTLWGTGIDDEAAQVRRMFDEQIGWAVEGGADLIIAETFSHIGEAEVALQAIEAAGLPAVITMAWHHHDGFLDATLEEGSQRLEQGGAAVVGLNCMRGPQTIMPGLKRIRAAVSCHVAAMPVPYRTTEEQPTFQSLHDSCCGCIPEDRPFPVALDPFTCNRYELAEFAKETFELGVKYIGLCCGGSPHHIRAMAEALGRTPPASRFSPDMSKHFAFGKKEHTHEGNRELKAQL
jgi:betaine-homocysteine S-methyltransferase